MGGGTFCDGIRWRDVSSREYKQDIATLTVEQAYETLADLNPVTFKYKAAADTTHVGFIAEDVPDLVASHDRTGLSAMDIVGILTKVVQHQQQQLAALQARLIER